MQKKLDGKNKLIVLVAIIAIGAISWKVADQKKQSSDPESTLIKDNY